MKKRFFWRLSVIFFVSLSIVLFSSLAMASGTKYGGTLRIGTRVPQFHRMDIRYSTLETMAPAAHMICDRLFNWGPNGYEGLVPALATSYETKDNKVWIVHLRKGVKFHNGREMTAQDVKTNLDWRIVTPKGWKPIKFKELIKYLKQVEVVDNYTVKIVLDEPFAPLMRVLAYSVRGIVAPEEVEKWGKKFAAHPSGTGPFKVVEIKPKERMILERFDDYWGPKPYVDRVVYKYYRSNEARLIALQKGEIDMGWFYDEARPILEKDPNLLYEAGNNNLVLHKHYFNFRRWPMNDIRFRRAMWMGADWKNIVINARAYKSGQYAPTLLDYSEYFNPEAAKLVPSYNPEEAKKLIKAVEKDAGKKIPPIFWLDTNSAIGKNIAEPAKIQLTQIGVTLNLQLLSHAIWYEKVLRDPKIEWDMAGYGAGFAVHPAQGFRYFETDSATAVDGKSLGGYSNPELDRLIKKIESATNAEEEKKYVHEAEMVLLKDVASLPLSAYRMLVGYNKNVKGFKLNNTLNIYPTNPYSNIWIEK